MVNLKIDRPSDSDSGSGVARLSLSGELDFATVPEVLPQLSGAVSGHARSVLDMSGVSAANSAALALLVELRRIAAAAGHNIEFRAVPDSVVKVAQVCEAEEFLK